MTPRADFRELEPEWDDERGRDSREFSQRSDTLFVSYGSIIRMQVDSSRAETLAPVENVNAAATNRKVNSLRHRRTVRSSVCRPGRAVSIHNLRSTIRDTRFWTTGPKARRGNSRKANQGRPVKALCRISRSGLVRREVECLSMRGKAANRQRPIQLFSRIFAPTNRYALLSLLSGYRMFPEKVIFRWYPF